jgi:hypothetical protein
MLLAGSSGVNEMNRLAYRSAAVAAAALIAVLAGCGTGGTGTPAVSKPAASGSTAASHPAASPATNGLEHQTAVKVAQAADAAYKAARTVRIQGTFLVQNGTEKFDLRYEGGSTSGTFTVNGATIHMITVGDNAYLKAGKRGWAAMGNPPDTQGLLANKWVKSGSAKQMLTPFSLATFASELTAEEFAHGGTVTQSTLAGQKVVVVTYPDGSKLYVANTGPAYPLHFDAAGSVGGRRDFSQYGATFHITAPPNPM